MASRTTTRSERETFALGENLGKALKGDEIILLFGELGAGKTVFAKGLASGMEVKDIHQVCSPSYTLVNVYQGKFAVFHIDLYRLSEEAEIMDLGWEDYIGQGVVIVEWAEKLRWDGDAMRVIIRMEKDDERRITIARSPGSRFQGKTA